MEELQEASLEMLVELARPTSHDTVLDYASGAGIAGFAVAPDVRHVEAADELPDTLDEGRRLAEELGLVNVSFTLVDLYALPYEDGFFSLVVCRNALHLLPEPVTALAELLRVTSGGGRIVIVDPVVDEVSDKAFNDLARLREPAHRRHYRPEELDGLVAPAGLRIKERRQLRRKLTKLEAEREAAHERLVDAENQRDRTVAETIAEVERYVDALAHEIRQIGRAHV